MHAEAGKKHASYRMHTVVTSTQRWNFILHRASARAAARSTGVSVMLLRACSVGIQLHHHLSAFSCDRYAQDDTQAYTEKETGRTLGAILGVVGPGLDGSEAGSDRGSERSDNILVLGPEERFFLSAPLLRPAVSFSAALVRPDGSFSSSFPCERTLGVRPLLVSRLRIGSRLIPHHRNLFKGAFVL